MMRSFENDIHTHTDAHKRTQTDRQTLSLNISILWVVTLQRWQTQYVLFLRLFFSFFIFFFLRSALRLRSSNFFFLLIPLEWSKCNTSRAKSVQTLLMCLYFAYKKKINTNQKVQRRKNKITKERRKIRNNP